MTATGLAVMQMLPPPEDRLYSTFQELHEDLKRWTLAQGYAVSIDSSSNRDATGIYRRYNLSCIRGGKVYKQSSTGQRNTVSRKTGCLMKIKATKQDAWPWNGRWRITVMCGDHNHPPFNPDVPNDVPPAFRHIEGEGLRWLLIMHREAKLNLRQLTIGLRTTFGDKYRFVKKSDVSNTLSKVKREEDKEMAKRPPGAPPVPPGAMTAFMAALLNPVPDPFKDGVPYELVPQGWPAVPNYQSTQQVAGQAHNGYIQQQGQPQQYMPPPQGQPPTQQYAPQKQQQYAPQGQAPQQQQQFAPPPPGQPQQQFTEQQFVPQQPGPSQGRNTPTQRNRSQGPPTQQQVQPAFAPQSGSAPTQQQPQMQMQWKHYTPAQPNPPPQQPQPQPQAQQPQQVQQPPQQAPEQQQYQSPYQSQPPPQQLQQPQQGAPPAAGAARPGPADRFRPMAGQPSVYQATALQTTPVPGVPGAVMMERAFSPVSDDESEAEAGGAEEEDGEADSE